jgi:tetratricopeptide (TPR) repeat protein
MGHAIRKKDPCPCGSGKRYKDCCLKKTKEINDHFREEIVEKGKEPEIEIPEDIELDFNNLDRETLLKKINQYFEELWDSTKVARLSIEEIVDKLKSMNVHFDKEQFLTQSAGYISACQLAEDHYYTQDWKGKKDEDFIWLAICELWKRFNSHNPSLEMIDDAICDGYDAFNAQEYESAYSEWKEIWNMIKQIIPSTVTDAANVIDIKSFYYDFLYWTVDYCEVLSVKGLKNPTFFHKRIDFVREFIEKFPDTEKSLIEELQLIKCESYAFLGEYEQAEPLFQSFISKYPENAAAYAVWGTMYWESNINPDYKKAHTIYRQGLARCKNDKKIIYDQLKKMKAHRENSPLQKSRGK